MMAIDDLLDRGRDARRRRDEAASELAAVLQALEGLAGVDMLDATQKRELARLRDRPRAKRRQPAPQGRGGQRVAALEERGRPGVRGRPRRATGILMQRASVQVDRARGEGEVGGRHRKALERGGRARCVKPAAPARACGPP